MELKIICMFEIRPSVGADTTSLSKCPPSSISEPPPLHPSIYMPWKFRDNRNTTAITTKEVITNFLQLLSRKATEGHMWWWQTCRVDFSDLRYLPLQDLHVGTLPHHYTLSPKGWPRPLTHRLYVISWLRVMGVMSLFQGLWESGIQPAFLSCPSPWPPFSVCPAFSISQT